MNNIAIMKLIASKSGEIPLLIKPLLLDIYEAYESHINELNLEDSPVFKIDMMFYRLHESGHRNTEFPLLSKALSSGKKLSRVITDYLSENSLNSPFSPVWYDYEELDEILIIVPETNIEIIIKEGGKEGRAKIKNEPRKPI